MTLKDYLAENIIIMDGATGTYYAQLMDSKSTISEKGNMSHPSIIETIHNQYIQAGAKLIRTNTFAANTVSLRSSIHHVKEVIKRAYSIAWGCTINKKIWVAANMGPIPEERDSEEEQRFEEYFSLIDTFLESGVKLFNFESFSDLHYLKQIIPYIKNKDQTVDIITSFSLNSYGYTKKGISVNRLLNTLKQMKDLTAFGFNCGVGIGHLYNIIKKIDIEDCSILVSPNAGYPDTIYERTVYQSNASYFADMMMQIKDLGVSIMGGCCGTTPKHIENICHRLQGDYRVVHRVKKENHISEKAKPAIPNQFMEKLKQNHFVLAVELDPPHSSNADKLMEGAHRLKAEGIDVITIADSPLGRARADAMLMAAKINKEVGIEVMPHICCRDKNIISIKSTIFGAYIEGIRNILLVTGDPIPSEERLEVKSVFNMNSIGLMSLMKELNCDFNEDDKISYGGALNPNLKHGDKIIKRVKAKKEAGAKFLLTQPIFDKSAIQIIQEIKNQVDIKILGGIMPLVSYKNAAFIKNEIAGMDIPDTIMNRFDKTMTREEAEKEGIAIAVDIGCQLKPYVDGLYMMTPFNRVHMILKILKQIDVVKGV